VHCVRLQWKPRLGRHALLREEAQKIAGRDPDFLRRDLWDAIEEACHPEWELALQLIPEEKAQALGIDLLDPTKLVPDEVVAPVVAGRLVLTRNPQDFFAESEQVAFHPGHLVPGIEFSNDPLLQGRLMSYTGSQIARLGGPNLRELPINRAVCPVHSFQRDGAGRAAIAPGRVSYEPNMLATGSEFRVDGGHQGFQSQAEAMGSTKTRRRPAEFDDHFSQASFFWNSQQPAERDHIIGALQHELCRLESGAVRQRVVDNLAHVDSRLARKVAEIVGLVPDAKAAAGRAGFRERRHKLAIETAASLSLESDAGRGIATRRVAVLVAPGVEVGALRVIQQALHEGRATCRLLAERLGSVATASGQQLAVDATFCSTASVLFDAVIVPGGSASVQALALSGPAVRFLLEAFKHCKTICAIGEGAQLLRFLALDADAAAKVPGVVIGRNEPPARAQLAQEFVAALARHRHWSRQHLDAIAV
jgi:catalase